MLAHSRTSVRAVSVVLLLALLVTSAILFAALFGSKSADAADSRCVAEVLVHEDESYSKLAVYLDSKKITHTWTVTPSATQGQTWVNSRRQWVANMDWSHYGPVFRGIPCRLQVVN